MPTVRRWSNENKPTDMIKKITGILFAAAVVAVIAAVVMHRGEYRSLLSGSGDAATEKATVVETDTLPRSQTAAGQAAADTHSEPNPADTTQADTTQGGTTQGER